jgi:hypothetical protein
MRPVSRSIDSSAVEVEPAKGSSCFGFSGVLSGQKRVPEPPARTTAHLIEAGKRGSGEAGKPVEAKRLRRE